MTRSSPAASDQIREPEQQYQQQTTSGRDTRASTLDAKTTMRNHNPSATDAATSSKPSFGANRNNTGAGHVGDSWSSTTKQRDSSPSTAPTTANKWPRPLCHRRHAPLLHQRRSSEQASDRRRQRRGRVATSEGPDARERTGCRTGQGGPLRQLLRTFHWQRGRKGRSRRRRLSKSHSTSPRFSTGARATHPITVDLIAALSCSASEQLQDFGPTIGAMAALATTQQRTSVPT